MSAGVIAGWATPLAAIRYAATGSGHYESFYIKANHPERRLGLWLKFNLLEPAGHPEALQGELWGVWFDGEQGRQVAAGQLLPREAVDARRGALSLRLGDATLELRGDALVEQAQVTGGGHRLAWDVRLEPTAPPAILFPARRLYEGGFPKKKVLTPIPRGRLDGWIEVDGERHALAGWEGLHGHNWGREHAFRYAYGNGLFTGGAYLDGFSAKLKLGPMTSPWLSLLLVRLPDGRELSFNRPARWLAGRPRAGDLRWQLDLPGPGGTRARLAMSADAADAVGLRYPYPDGRNGYCLNTKFGRGTLRVEERGRVLYQGDSGRCELETFGPRPVAGIEYLSAGAHEPPATP
ncbi:MAG TPA: hypothetical protein VFI42_14240 [Thermomicrobiaceae bacterium]|nr:hypothetical protein [Thermomicrobiaceae bacterium]